MSKQVVYRGVTLSKGSTALSLWEDWQRASGDQKNQSLKKLDQHLKEVSTRADALQGGPVPAHLVNYKIGEHPEDWV